MLKLIIRTGELLRLLRHSDSIDIKLVEKQLARVYKAIVITAFFDLLVLVTFGFTVYASQHPEIYFFSTQTLLKIFSLLGGLVFCQSFFQNKFLGHIGSVVVKSHFNKFYSDFKISNQTVDRKWREFYSGYLSYAYNLRVLLAKFLHFIFVIITVLMIDNSPTMKVNLMAGIFLFILIQSVFGSLFIRSALRIDKSLLSNKEPERSDVHRRVFAPFISNLMSDVALPFIAVALVIYDLPTYIPQLAFFSGVLAYSWSIVRIIEGLHTTRKYFNCMDRYFAKLSKRFIINNETYHKQSKLVTSSVELIIRSRENNSLILRNYTPMSITNVRKIERQFNYEFTPGIYQLHGRNGIGKTTLLESITLTPDELVEFATGEAAFNGKNLFDEQGTLNNHRNNFVYLGKNSMVYDINNINSDIIPSNSSLEDVINYLRTANGSKLSDGEKAIVNIFAKISHLSDKSFIVIDELISRVYEDEFTPCRSELVRFLQQIAYEKNLIIVLVDHVINIEGIKHIRMTLEGLEEIEGSESIKVRNELSENLNINIL